MQLLNPILLALQGNSHETPFRWWIFVICRGKSISWFAFETVSPLSGPVFTSIHFDPSIEVIGDLLLITHLTCVDYV
jgi:hypothetical protein